MKLDWFSRVVMCIALFAGAISFSGCSLIGVVRAEKTTSVTLVNARGFDDGDPKYFFAIYDGNIPEDKSRSLLQLYSQPASRKD